MAFDCAPDLRLLLARRQKSGPIERGRFNEEIEALWEEWILTERDGKANRAPDGPNVLCLGQGPEGVERTTKKYSPTDSWQVVRLADSCSPRATVQIDLHQVPSQFWIRKAAWHFGGKETPASLKPGPNGILEDFGDLRLTAVRPRPPHHSSPGKWSRGIGVRVHGFGRRGRSDGHGHHAARPTGSRKADGHTAAQVSLGEGGKPSSLIPHPSALRLSYRYRDQGGRLTELG